MTPVEKSPFETNLVSMAEANSFNAAASTQIIPKGDGKFASATLFVGGCSKTLGVAMHLFSVFARRDPETGEWDDPAEAATLAMNAADALIECDRTRRQLRGEI